MTQTCLFVCLFVCLFHVYINIISQLKRFQIFKNNLQLISQHNELYNKGESSYTMGINEFMDMVYI